MQETSTWEISVVKASELWSLLFIVASRCTIKDKRRRKAQIKQIRCKSVIWHKNISATFEHKFCSREKNDLIWKEPCNQRENFNYFLRFTPKSSHCTKFFKYPPTNGNEGKRTLRGALKVILLSYGGWISEWYEIRQIYRNRIWIRIRMSTV
jgi:hypothetical protein